MRKAIVLGLAVFLFGQTNIEARSARVSQIPNGSVNSCSNCHVAPAGGGTRTAFGDVINNGFLNGSGARATVVWNATLAGLDSDGDGFSNGTELGDPEGDGTPTAGATVTNPGLSSSFPQVANNPPVIAGLAGQTVNEGEGLKFAVSATDPNSDAVTFTASELPEGATFEGGNFVWTPGFDQGGAFVVTFTASVGKEQASTSVDITVVDVPRPLVINSFAPSKTLLVGSVGDTSRMSVTAESPDVGSVTYAWQVNGIAQAETSGSFLLDIVNGSVDDVLTVTASDDSGSLTQSWTVAKALKGDFDGNNEVAFSDFLTLVGAFGKSSADPDFNPTIDINGNGVVDFPDFLEFVSFFGLRL
ncbi:MAG: hypothetical protein HOE48_23220 [Candidatus Latescibacteria bacterium]|nr:hypothetical protein [Candidatus Latescibacterota bacterium]